MGEKLLHLFAVLLSVDVAFCAFRSINCCDQRQLIQEQYHVFRNDPNEAACPIIPVTDLEITDFVLQPGSQIGIADRDSGSFWVEEGSEFSFIHSRLPCKMACLSQLGNPSTGCFEQPEAMCDQLIFRLNSVDIRGEFLVQYRYGSGQSNITVRYSPPGLYYTGDPQDLTVEVDTTEKLLFELRPRDATVNVPTLCDLLPDGFMQVSQKISAGIPRALDTCIRAFRDTTAMPTAYELPIDLNTTGLMAGTCDLFVTQGTCGVDTPDNVIRLTIVPDNNNRTTTTASATTLPSTTTMETTTELEPTSTSMPTEEGFSITTIIGVCAGIGTGLIIGIVILIVIICCCKNRIKIKSATIGPNHEKGQEEVRLQSLKQVEEDIKVDDNVKVDHTTTTMTYGLQTASGAHHSTTVSRVAFVSASESGSYKSLEEAILTQHGGQRVQPVARPSVNENCTYTITDFWHGISKLLKTGDTLVYIIWSGALERVNGNHYPPIKKLISSLANRPLKRNDSQGSSTVMHRLVFLQLGSKGSVDHLLSNLNSITIFWEVSGDDPSFEAQKCAQEVCDKVKRNLKTHCENMEEASKHSTKSHAVKSSYAGNSDKHLTVGRENVDTPASPVHGIDQLDSTSTTSLVQNQPSTVSLDDRTIDKLGDRVGDRVGEHLGKQLKNLSYRFDDLEKGVEFVADKVVQRDAGPQD